MTRHPRDPTMDEASRDLIGLFTRSGLTTAEWTMVLAAEVQRVQKMALRDERDDERLGRKAMNDR